MPLHNFTNSFKKGQDMINRGFFEYVEVDASLGKTSRSLLSSETLFVMTSSPLSTPLFSSLILSLLHTVITSNNTKQGNCSWCDWDYKVGNQGLLRKGGLLCKSESQNESDPWTITLVHTNGTIRVQCKTKSKESTSK